MAKQMVGLTPPPTIRLTGRGALTPLGTDVTAQWDAIQAGGTGLKMQSIYGGYSCPVATIETSRSTWKAQGGGLSFPEYLSIQAIEQTIAGRYEMLEEKDLCFIFCSAKGNVEALSGARGPYSAAQVAKNIGQHFGMVNQSWTVSTACASGLSGLVLARRLLVAGYFRRALVVGCDVVSRFTLRGFQTLQAISKNTCRPYDGDRDGTNLGEAAAAILLEYGIPQPGEVVLSGGATSNDGTHISRPAADGAGMADCINRTLNRQQPDFICGHGTATIFNDNMEAAAFERTGLASVPVLSLKAQLGHTLGACGVLETIIASRCIQENTLPASACYHQPGTTPSLNVNTVTRPQQLESCLKTAAGFGGANAAILLKQIPSS